MNTESADRNVKFMVLSYDIATEGGGNTRTRVYSLNPGDRFGGSRQGLLVTKTASLIIRQTGPFGLRDSEHHIADPNAWGTVNAGLKLAAAQGTLHHVGMVHE